MINLQSKALVTICNKFLIFQHFFLIRFHYYIHIQYIYIVSI
jgi:hypothetical protein